MAIEIKAVETGPIGSGTGQPVERVRNSAGVATGTPSGPSAPAPDRVNITGTARLLVALQAAVSASPDIDMKRVEPLRQLVDRGLYTPNPGRIADRLIQLESDLAAATGRAKG